MKTALPENAKIAKEAKECMQECVSEFISFITSEGMCCTLLMFVPVADWLCHSPSLGKVSAGEAKNRQWGGHTLRHDLARLRELRRGPEDLPNKIPRSTTTIPLSRLVEIELVILDSLLTSFSRHNLPVVKTSRTVQEAATATLQGRTQLEPHLLQVSMPAVLPPLLTKANLKEARTTS